MAAADIPRPPLWTHDVDWGRVRPAVPPSAISTPPPEADTRAGIVPATVAERTARWRWRARGRRARVLSLLIVAGLALAAVLTWILRRGLAG